ncbi:hypothetical protein D9M68_953560 [compost metagenome]
MIAPARVSAPSRVSAPEKKPWKAWPIARPKSAGAPSTWINSPSACTAAMTISPALAPNSQ